MSQFDTLLDFDAPAENGPSNHGPSNHGQSTLDDFDPFGPIPSLDKNGGPSLLDEFESELKSGTTRQNGSNNLLIDISGEPSNSVSSNYSPGTKFDTSNQLFDLSENMDNESNTDEVSQLVEQTENGDLEYSFTETVTTTTSDHDEIPVIAMRRSRSYDSDKAAHSSFSSDDEKHTNIDKEMVVKVTDEQQWYTDEKAHNGYDNDDNDNQFETNITETVYYADEHEHEGDHSDDDRKQDERHDHKAKDRHHSSSSSDKSDSDKNDHDDVSQNAPQCTERNEEGDVQKDVETRDHENVSLEQSQAVDVEADTEELAPKISSNSDIIENEGSWETSALFSTTEATTEGTNEVDNTIVVDDVDEKAKEDVSHDDISVDNVEFETEKEKEAETVTLEGDQVQEEQEQVSQDVSSCAMVDESEHNDAETRDHEHALSEQSQAVDVEAEAEELAPEISSNNNDTIEDEGSLVVSGHGDTDGTNEVDNKIIVDYVDEKDKEDDTTDDISVDKAEIESEKEVEVVSLESTGQSVLEEQEQEHELIRDGQIVYTTKDEKQFSDNMLSTLSKVFGKRKSSANDIIPGDDKEDVPTPTTPPISPVFRFPASSDELDNNDLFIRAQYINLNDLWVHAGEQHTELITSTNEIKFTEMRNSNDPNMVAVDEPSSPYLHKPPYADDSDEEEISRDPNIARESKDTEDIRCSDMSNFRQHFESGGNKNRPVSQAASDLDDLRQANVQSDMLKSKFENIAKDKDRPMERKGIKEITPPLQDKIVYGTDEEQPRDPNIVRSVDAINEDDYLPKTGTSREIMQRLQNASSQQVTKSQRPLREEIQNVEGGVYESTPTEFVQWANRADGGVFENEPVHDPDVIRSDINYDATTELPESGYAKNVVAKFRQIQNSPDQYSGGPKPARREITPPSDANRVEFVSEPRGHVERYEGKAEAGIFESQPQIRTDVVRSNEVVFEEQLPEEGYTRNLAEKFKRLEKEGSTYTPTPKQRDFTPPTEGGVYENQPVIMPDVVRSSEKVEETEILPQQGTAKNLVARFQSIEQTSKSPPSPKDRKLFTPPRDIHGEAGVFENEPERFVYYENKAEGGVFENQPVLRDDVVRENKASQEEELPEQGTSRNLIARFKQMESQSRTSSSVSPRTFKQFTPPRDEPRLKSPRSPSESGGINGVQPGDMPEQYQTQTDGGIYENQPQIREDVYKEANTDYSEGLPAENTTRHMVDRFKHIQAEAKKSEPKPVPRKFSIPKTPPLVRKVSKSVAQEGGAITPRFLAIRNEKCAACGKTVYAMEKMEFNQNAFHKTCFKCSHCKNQLTPGTFSVNAGILYCMNHFKQLFKTKGNYDEGFGRQLYRKRWRSEPTLLNTETDEDDEAGRPESVQ